jgi:hemerythrin-like domain-containing protein
MIREPFGSVAPGFDDPLGMLRACHERILRHCDTLIRVAEHVAQHGVDEEVRRACARVHQYFSTSGQYHHEDEERDLFPLLPSLAGLIGDLHRDHEAMEQQWRRLEPLLAQPERIASTPDFAQQAQKFLSLYTPHIARENTELLPQAAKLLTGPQVLALGAAMARRRGVNP